MSQLEDIKARADAATDGTWRSVRGGVAAGREQVAADVRTYADAAFIAAARTDVPKLVAALEAVDAISKRVSQEAVDKYNKARVLPFDERAVAAANAVEFEVIATDIYAAIEEALR